MAETRQFLTRRLRDLLTNLRAFPRAGERGRVPPSLPRAVVGARLLAAASEAGLEEAVIYLMAYMKYHTLPSLVEATQPP